MKRTMSGLLNKAKSNIKRMSKSALKAVNNNVNLSRRTLFIAPVALLVTTVSVMGLSFDSSCAYAVSYKGETIGYVSSQEVYTEAVSALTENSDAAACEKLNSLQVEEKVATGKQIMNAEDLTKAIVENVDEIEESYGLFVNGELYASCSSKENINNAIAKYAADNSNDLADATIAGDWNITKGVYSTYTFLTEEELVIKFNNDALEVCGYKTETYTEKVKYDTVTKKSDKYAKGETVTENEGENGKRKVTEKVYYVGDEAVSKEEISSEITKKPVDKKIVKGTGSLESKAKMSFPLKEESGYNITSYYGEARYGYYHKGLDIIAGYGTGIYAAAGGTVVESGYSNGGWGYTVLIDHGNGIRSRYAHCSTLNVSVGEKVNRGDLIAGVGSTGNSECNHLHFEVSENGVRVNPMNYLD